MPFDAAKKGAAITLSNSDRTATKTSGAAFSAQKALCVVGHDPSDAEATIYFECVYSAEGTSGGAYIGVGIASTYTVFLGSSSSASWGYEQTGQTRNNSTIANTGYDSFAAGDRIAVALKGAKIWFGKISAGVITWQGGGDPALDTSPAYTNVAGTVYPGMSIDSVNDEMIIYTASGDWAAASPWVVPGGVLTRQRGMNGGMIELSGGMQ